MGEEQSKIKYYDGSEYKGNLNENGKEHGEGKILYSNGDVLEGNFSDGKCNYGRIKYQNENRYTGYMLDNKFHGAGAFKSKDFLQKGLFRHGNFVHGIVKFADGTVYEGSLEGNLKNGKGILINPKPNPNHNTNTNLNGFRYEGYFKDDKFEGIGCLEYLDNVNNIMSKFDGEFKNGEENGKGKLVKKNNNNNAKCLEYKGEFVDGEFHGKDSVLIYENNDKYEGAFVHGKKHGYGEYTYNNGDVYKGNWENDAKCDDNGMFVFKNGATYTGGFKDGKFHGKGKLVKYVIDYRKVECPNGKLQEKEVKYISDYHEGEYLNGKRHGKGLMKSSNDIFIGTFENDEKNGMAKIVYDSGDVFLGEFRRNEKHGRTTLKGENTELVTHYDNGVKHGPYKILDKGQNYEEEGQYENGEKHGNIYVTKEGFKSCLVYEKGQKIGEEEISQH